MHFFLLVVLLGFWSPGNSSRALHVPGKDYQSINVSPSVACVSSSNAAFKDIVKLWR